MAKNAENVIVIPPSPADILIAEVGGPGMLHNRNRFNPGTKGGDRKDYSKKEFSWKEDTVHIFAEGKHKGEPGFSTGSFTSAMASVINCGGISLSNKKLEKYGKNILRAMHIESDGFDQDDVGCVAYTAGQLVCCRHMANPGRKGKMVPIYRGLVRDWKIVLRIVFNSSMIRAEEVALLLRRAGESIGVGAFRLENGGEFGSFELLAAKVLCRTPNSKVA